MSPRRGRLIVLLTAVWVLVPTALAAARRPEWWTWIAPELTPMTWVQTVVLMLAAAGSLLVGTVLRRTGAPRTWVWPVLGAGFLALAVDDRFALHERVRDGYLAPRGITVPFLPWVAPGDFLIMGVAVAGLAFLPAVWRAVRVDAWSRSALAVGVLLAVAAVGLDSVDPHTWSTAGERLQQSFEEVLELGSGLALFGAVALRLMGLLAIHVRPAAAPSAAPPVEEPARP
ncbi:hypothetical protein [Streptomonospora litoralis]|uniref:Uncharacterized protein n=1 Tax=Streptomonospora litoralis TaxID=2498135 RepID=A0A4P6PWX5_9ACTN|nr:hypothetical protein [Streptomonospora litoralis]QBI52615.1 hypothetical protein EKD16_04025 [Streptomonospora litoralis]